MTDRARKSTGNRYAPIVAALCQSRGWPLPVAEHKFHDTRRWRFDLAWPALKLAAEVNGGVFVGGRHSRGAGQMKDYEKLNSAQILGWVVLQVTPRQVVSGDLERLLGAVFSDKMAERDRC